MTKIKILGLAQPILDKIFFVVEENLQQLNILKKGGSKLYTNYEEFAKFEKSVLSIQPEYSLCPGGSCSNTMKGVSLLGVASGIIGKIGSDETGDLYLDSMKKRGVFADYLSKSKTHCGECICLITPDGERTMNTYLGASQEMCVEDLNEEHFSDIKLLHIEGYQIYFPKLMKEAMKIAKKQNSIITYDLGSFQIVNTFKPLIDEILTEYVDIVFCNEEELAAFNKDQDMYQNLNSLASKCKIAVATLGKRGCMIQTGDKVYKCPANILKQKVNTIGAGDLFISGFLYGLVSGYSIDECGIIGCVTGSEACRYEGAEIPIEKSKDLQEKIQKKNSLSL
eukprot:gene7668-12134_t